MTCTQSPLIDEKGDTYTASLETSVTDENGDDGPLDLTGRELILVEVVGNQLVEIENSIVSRDNLGGITNIRIPDGHKSLTSKISEYRLVSKLNGDTQTLAEWKVRRR